MAATLAWLLAALHFVNPTQIVMRERMTQSTGLLSIRMLPWRAGSAGVDKLSE